MTEPTDAANAPGSSDPNSITMDDFELPGVPDAFQRLWTPHRMAYIKGGQSQFDHPDDCPFCVAPERSDQDSLIVARGKYCYAVLNLFPYNPGHLLINPYRHVPHYVDLSPEEVAEFGAMTQIAVRVLKAVSNPAGFNIGMNQGKAGGAGISEHLHQHVVPRWGGDSNFLPIIANTKALTQTLGEVRDLVASGWPTPASPLLEAKGE